MCASQSLRSANEAGFIPTSGAGIVRDVVLDKPFHGCRECDLSHGAGGLSYRRRTQRLVLQKMIPASGSNQPGSANQRFSRREDETQTCMSMYFLTRSWSSSWS